MALTMSSEDHLSPPLAHVRITPLDTIPRINTGHAPMLRKLSSGFFDQASPPTKPYVLSFPVIYFTHARTNRRFLASSSLVQISLFLRTTSLRTVVSVCPPHLQAQ